MAMLKFKAFWHNCLRHVEVILLLAILLLTILQIIGGNFFILAPEDQFHDRPAEVAAQTSYNDASRVVEAIQQYIPKHEPVTQEDNEKFVQAAHDNTPQPVQVTRRGTAWVVQTSLENIQKQASPDDGLLENEAILDNTSEVAQETDDDAPDDDAPDDDAPDDDAPDDDAPDDDAPDDDAPGAEDTTQQDASSENESTPQSFDENDTGGASVSGIQSTAVTTFQDQVLATVAHDTILRKQAFLKKYVHCKEENETQPVGDSCALQLKIPEVAADSINFDHANAKLERDRLRFMEQLALSSADGRRKTVLIWRVVWTHSHAEVPETLRACPVCRFTTNESESDVAAVLMSSYEYRKSMFTFTLPTRKTYPGATMVVYEYEAPPRSGAVGFTGIVDYTFGYRRDSDIVKTNGYIRLRTEPLSWSDIVTRNSRKFKMATWFVSNCQFDESERSQLSKTLQRNGVQVDIYGRCGSLTCPKRNSQCLEMLETDYKFYFAFENSLCNQYVTEKFYKALRYSAVPITYGLGHELTGAPKSSYIDVFDFPDVKSLADYIIYLDSNATAYNEYFRWQLTYEVDLHVRLREKLCELCQILVDGTEPERRYSNFESWATEGQCVAVNVNTTVGKFIRGLSWRLRGWVMKAYAEVNFGALVRSYRAPVQLGGAPVQLGGAPVQLGGAPVQRGGAPVQRDGAPIQQGCAFFQRNVPVGNSFSSGKFE
ncbi:Glycosyl transferase family 10 [Trinorchestia longiramus]|nr:Glycosyl transferase family 10 [Trinorchestia longiramus]